MNIYKELYNSINGNNIKQKLENIINNYIDNPQYSDDNGRLLLLIPGDNRYIKIAYNNNGLYRNYIEAKKHLDFPDKSDNLLGEIELLSSEGFEFLKKREVLDKVFKNRDFNITLMKNLIFIIAHPVGIYEYYYKNEHIELEKIYNNSAWYYSLKKSIMNIEKNALIGNISPTNFMIFWDNTRFLDLDKVYVKKNDNNSFISCPRCNSGNLRFDIDHFLETSHKKDWEAKYNCTNSTCDNNPTFSELKSYDTVKDIYFFEEKEKHNFDKLLRNEGIEMAEVANKGVHISSNTQIKDDRVALVGGKYGTTVCGEF